MINTNQLKKLFEKFKSSYEGFESDLDIIEVFIEYVEKNDSVSSKELVQFLKSNLYDIEHGNSEEFEKAIELCKPVVEIINKHLK